MFADPQSVTVSAAPVSLPKVATAGRSSVYESANGELTLTISHSNNKRSRSVVRLDRKVIGADALNPATNKQYSMSTYLVIDYPFVGFTDAVVQADAQALIDYCDVAANLTKIIGQES